MHEIEPADLILLVDEGMVGRRESCSGKLEVGERRFQHANDAFEKDFVEKG